MRVDPQASAWEHAEMQGQGGGEGGDGREGGDGEGGGTGGGDAGGGEAPVRTFVNVDGAWKAYWYIPEYTGEEKKINICTYTNQKYAK